MRFWTSAAEKASSPNSSSRWETRLPASTCCPQAERADSFVDYIQADLESGIDPDTAGPARPDVR